MCQRIKNPKLGDQKRSIQSVTRPDRSKTLSKILKAYGIEKVVDVRTIPRSRHNPQFNKDTLRESLRSVKIKYLNMPELGGLRHASSNSVNTGWRNLSFRGYADHMQSDEFESALQKLIEISSLEKVTLMCAESLPWRCHRSLIADALLVRNIRTMDIFSATISRRHTLTPWARVRGKKITYPEETTTA